MLRNFHLRFSVCVIIIASALSWLIVGETSPFCEYFLWHVAIPNFWETLNFIPFATSVIAGGHSGNEFAFYVGFAVQWFIIGLALSFAVSAFRKKTSNRTRNFD